MRDGSIKTVEAGKVYTCREGPSKGARLTLRRAKPSDRTRLMAKVGDVGNSFAYGVALAQLCTQWGIVDAEGLTDEAGNEVKFGVEPCPPLGKVAREAVYDALDTDDVKAVFEYVFSGAELPQETQGN